MECEEKGGSMHSVEFAQQQKCPIFCPNPGPKIGKEQSGLKYIIDNHIGDIIENGVDYQNVIKAAGYKVEMPAMRTKSIKEQYLKALIIGIEDDSIIKSSLENLSLNYISDFTNRYNLINYLLDFVEKSNHPISVVINTFIDSIVATYNTTEKEG